MASSPPPAGTGTGQEEVEMVSEEASLPLHAAETGAGGDGGAPSASEDQAGGDEGDAMDEDEGGSSDDSYMEEGEEEDEEEEDSGYSSDSSLESDEVHRVWENMKKKMAAGGGGGGMHTKNPAVATCCVCMEPWTSDGAHRICCIPCGHVYGRSCLEKWLRRCGGAAAKCPQCGESFEKERIINLYGTEYLWNDCIHDQELKLLVCQSLDQLKENMTLAMERMVVRIDEKMAVFTAEVASLMEKMTNMIVSKDGDGTATPTPDGMLKFLSQNWPKLPRPHRSHE